MRQIEDEEGDEEALSQAIETFVALRRAVRKRAATSKVVDNIGQAKQANIGKAGGRGGRGSCRDSGKV